jgi:hypothetical protein
MFSPMTGRLAISRRTLALALAAPPLLCLSAYGALPAIAQAAAYLLPTLVLLVALAARRYPGEQALLSIAGRCRQRRPHARFGGRTFAGRSGRAASPRGGTLIASSLAGRAPPLAVAALA